MVTSTAAQNDPFLPVIGQCQFRTEAVAILLQMEWLYWPAPGAEQLVTAGKWQSGFLIT